MKITQKSIGEIYPLLTFILEDFLCDNNFFGVYIAKDYTIWAKDNVTLHMPHQKKLFQTEINNILSAAELNKTEFEDYVEYFFCLPDSNQIINMHWNVYSLKQEREYTNEYGN